ncbi:hypothetical protein TEA_026443 [Camellia sinensis var. sinensis]|uniref:Uncharacterized protein n=1 Tax=Camellia sinensis var. sinensis TaxID=542762 RepID=A0A4S4CXD4_CAMSN|nr:hypothetical protein TEA_026443 [Camellia sinensis var. sinensis]
MARTELRKRKRREEKYDTEDIEQFMEEEIDGVMGKEEIENAPDEEKETENVDELAGIPIEPYDHKAQTGAIFILEKASLEVAKLGKFYQLLSSDHDKFLRSNNKNPADYRPDIAHQSWAVWGGFVEEHYEVNKDASVQENLLVSASKYPLNKAGRLRALYVKTENGVLFEIKPYVRIPRTYKRFSGIMSLLLQKLSITAVGESEKLLRVIKNLVTQYLPLNSRKIGFSYISEKLVDIRDYVAAVSDDVNFVFVVGAMAHGKIDIKDYADDFISNPQSKNADLRGLSLIATVAAKEQGFVFLNSTTEFIKSNPKLHQKVQAALTKCKEMYIPIVRDQFPKIIQAIDRNDRMATAAFDKASRWRYNNPKLIYLYKNANPYVNVPNGFLFCREDQYTILMAVPLIYNLTSQRGIVLEK